MSAPDLLARLQTDEHARELLAPLGFADWRIAWRRLRELAPSPAAAAMLAELLPHLLPALLRSAAPDRALNNLERFVRGADHPVDLLARLTGDPNTLEMLVTLLAGSQYLTEILLRNPGYFALLEARSGIAQIKSAGWLRAEARTATDPWLTGPTALDATSAALDALRRYQQRELLRIGLADLNGLLALNAVTAQLSRLAEAVVQTALEIVAAQIGVSPAGFVVLGMGKLGGGELNYSSDVDLLFLAAEDGGEDGTRLGEHLIRALTEATTEGFLYRVDMRLRPWGRVGPLTPTVRGYLTYLERHARLWERQALLRGRPIAGDLELGWQMLRRAEPLLFVAGPAGQRQVRAEVHAMKQLTEANLRQAGRTWGEVKLGEGSIRDAEFVAQYLQLTHGADHPRLRGGNTVLALARLAEAGHLSSAEHRILADGYTFLRTVEHYLQILDYRQTHTLPANPADLRYLARRLGFEGTNAGREFTERYEQHSAAVRAVYLHHLAGDGDDARPHESPPHDEGTATMRDSTQAHSDAAREHLARLAPSYAATFTPVEIEHHALMAAQLDGAHPVVVDVRALADGKWRVTIVGFDYLGELSIICGLMFAYGFSILDGHVYTYEPGAWGDTRRKIVDAFTVQGDVTRPAVWREYERDLSELVGHLQARQPRTAQGALAKLISSALRTPAGETPTLPPVDIEIDNAASERYTVLQISAPDTPGFLYEFTNALALGGIHIAQVFVISAGNRVRDTLFVTDSRGQKVTTPERQRELRAATVLIKHFTHLLPRSPNPEAALLHFHEYLGELFARPSWPDELASLERPEVLDALARLLGVSEFLWDDFLRMQYENLFPVVRDVDALAAAQDRPALAATLRETLRGATDWREALNAFKDREMFRVDMRHILGRSTFAEFAAELTALVEAVLAETLEQALGHVSAQHGAALDAAGQPARCALLALGKAGGCELGFASDIELMFVYEGGGQTSGPKILPTGEFFEKVVVEVTRAIEARREGIFNLDLQLRPYGKAGSLAVALDAFRKYFAPDGPAWPYERQALVKLRAFAGDARLGAEVTELRDRFLYSGVVFDVTAMRAMRERQIRHLVPGGTVNAKYSKGGLVDVEYIVQGLQITHGRRYPELRVTNTAAAIRALHASGIISDENAARLQEALLFLQQLINALRMVRGNNKELTAPPVETEEFAFLARRLGYGNDAPRLAAKLTDHMAWVQRLEGRLLG